MDKLNIKKISKSLYKFRGFDERGCYGSKCQCQCCQYGADVDKEAYDLIKKNRKIIEKRLNKKLEDCFHKTWYKDDEYLGGSHTRTKMGNTGYCIFHMSNIEGKGVKGCLLYFLASKKKISKRIVPTICRLYPISWGNETLYLTDDFEKECNCLCNKNNSKENILETQKKDIEDIFDIKIKK